MAGSSMEETTETTEAETETETSTSSASTTDVETVVSQAQNPDAVKKALQAERDAAKAARDQLREVQARLKEFEDRDKSDLQRLTEERDTLKTELGKLESKTMRLDVATRKNLPAELVPRLQGSTIEELERDADQLLSLVTKASRGSADLGAREGAKGVKQISREDLKSMTPQEIVQARKDGRLKDAAAGVV